MNPDIPHKGIRGGSMGTQYRGQLEGVTKESRDFVYENAKAEGISAYKWLENLIAEKKRG